MSPWTHYYISHLLVKKEMPSGKSYIFSLIDIAFNYCYCQFNVVIEQMTSCFKFCRLPLKVFVYCFAILSFHEAFFSLSYLHQNSSKSDKVLLTVNPNINITVKVFKVSIYITFLLRFLLNTDVKVFVLSHYFYLN